MTALMGPIEAEMRGRYAAAAKRLRPATPPPERPKRPRPISPFDPRRMPPPPPPPPPPVQLADLVVPDRPWKVIALEVASQHNLTLPELLSRRRWPEIVKARHEAFWRCSKETTMSLPAIGRAFGGFDHTTVLHGINMHEARIALGEAV